MALKPAICTQCGGQIEVDDTKEAGICQFCGTAFITEKVIKQYVTQNNFAGATFNIQGGVDDENLYMLARRAVEQNNVADILKYYGQLVERHPNDWEAVFYSSFFKGDDTIVLPNLELALNLLFDSVVITRENHDDIYPEVQKMFSMYLEKHGGNDYRLSQKLGTRSLLLIFEKLLNKEIEKNNNKNNYNIRLLIWAIFTIEQDKKYFSWYKFTRESLLKVFKLDFDENLSEEDKKIILELFIDYFDWFMTTPIFYGLKTYEEMVESCPFINNDEQMLNLYKTYIETWGHRLKKKEYKNLIRQVKEKDSTYKPPKRETTPEKETRKSLWKKFFKFILFFLPFAIVFVPWDGYSCLWEDHPFLSFIIGIPSALVYWYLLYLRKL